MARTIVHVDMDAFFASVEQLDDASLRGKPVIVGGRSGRGVVCAASYEARPFGVRSAMPMVEAVRRCPQGVVVPPRHHRYAEVSARVFDVFRRYTPLVEGLSLDEAFLDVTGSRALHGTGEEIAAKIKADIRRELGLTASAGVAPSKFVAKIASDVRKPDGLCVVREDEVRAFLDPMPIERMWGMGARTSAVAHAHGFHTLADLARADDVALGHVFGSSGPFMASLARGEDDREVEPDREAKSIGAEDTFEEDLRNRESIERALLSQAMRVAGRLVDERLAARVVTVKIKHADFTVVTRRTTLAEPTYDTDTLHRTARRLLERVDLARPRVRLTGISVSELTPLEDARTLFPDPVEEKSRSVERLRASLRDRFGEGALTRASLLERRERKLRDD